MQLAEIILGFLIIFVCGLGIYLFGAWVSKQTDKPVGFWANGDPIDPKTVTDIPGYNRELGKVFRIYAFGCLASAVLLPFAAAVSLILLIIWGIFGTWWLIRSYKRMEKRYILR